MNLATAPADHDPSRFEQAAAAILNGSLRLMGDLSQREFERGRTDCAFLAIDFTRPGVLAIVVLRKRRFSVVASYQEGGVCMWSDEVDPPRLGIPEAEQYVTAVMRRITAAVGPGAVPDDAVMTFTDREVCLPMLQLYTGTSEES
jgi:hypothetical protein